MAFFTSYLLQVSKPLITEKEAKTLQLSESKCLSLRGTEKKEKPASDSNIQFHNTRYSMATSTFYQPVPSGQAGKVFCRSHQSKNSDWRGPGR